ncbi:MULTISPECIES: 2,3-bisphosphoglycerate-dependent phosphoglycerate mutase [Burkholderia cepacia complex]|jgi:2,3-bisphosphoglycerate-dependent phosphoglycerate mutase|uniref:2,3-bisphosphoglycerate-dependent phosphoglycerate mutase n=1 Tax=Burkholderia vietnamiensis TaxID=60552 RepID=A0AAW7T6E2_BURVI|nr:MULTISPECIES: 2,3-bisphosphoglycerate-dependent phosphoglycerate mutase [Burkholderia cepacia complex]EGD06330.1 phosphoglycerate mutase 1 family protein [Burkholderia sp. TJI49]MBR8372994.1 2,3-bisphosphoglycerate-dependent phosphoglycerate mutase [Burkholderia cenocepacia]MBR8441919.1 2,3-bisphosphoglycerate-dependent phosphoglycerate mutase [Burkholderia cenocepacia]MBU9142451.1 2,3-bisphosphoglycerate-dependent phosphoglycerate mutase [Burkholderia multivorans]MBU9205544.1 2,3-bisphosph
MGSSHDADHEGEPSHFLVLVRHGESEWNRDGRFTGWTDIDLTVAGEDQAREAGRILARDGWQFDLAYTSVLKRSIRTLWLMLEELDQTWIPVVHDWRLNERHYGCLTGMRKLEAVEIFGELAVQKWRRSYRGRPPPISATVEDRRYRRLLPDEIPRTESLCDTERRVSTCWRDTLAPAIKSGFRVIVCGHGNGLRALVKILDALSEADIMSLDIPNGMPLVYRFDLDMTVIDRFYIEALALRESNIL